MRNAENRKTELILCAIGILPVVWAALAAAPFLSEGLFGIINGLSSALYDPTRITLCKDSPRAVLTFLLIYAVGLGVYFSTRRNYRKREEHGSAKWGEATVLNSKYADTDWAQNKILTKRVSIGFDTHKHRRNMNVLVVGGSGAGKTRFYAKPNIMQCNTSFVVLDPKGEILRDTGGLLEAQGYDIKVLDLINMDRSHCYNPFVYLWEEKDVLKLVTNLIRNTTPKGSNTNDPFWGKAETALLMALIFYLRSQAPESERNFPMIMEMLDAADVREDNEDYQSPLDALFSRLALNDARNIAVMQYGLYKKAAGKTAKSILVSLGVRLAAFNLRELAGITTYDDMDFHLMGERKTALFAVIPDNDRSFNFLVGMLYTQLFQTLAYQADNIHHGRLPVHVHCLMDEFANVALPDDFDGVLSTIRGREISVSIILQNLAQLKALFEKQWESIVGNCDEFVYLGGNEQSTHKYVSELLGKETIDINTYGQSKGRNGSYSTNWQLSGRELMTPDEVRMLDNRFALLFIRGEYAVMDDKYDLLKHPNLALTADGGAPLYEHGSADRAIDWSRRKLLDESSYELFTEEELISEFLEPQQKTENKEISDNEKQSRKTRPQAH